MTAPRLDVLQVVHALPSDTYGGSELYTKHLSEELADRGHRVAIASPMGDGSEIRDDVEVVKLPATEPHPDAEPQRRQPDGDDGPRSSRDLGPARGLVRPCVEARFEEVLDERDPDVVHFQHLKGLSARLPVRCSERGIASLVTLHDFWTICHREQLRRPDGARCRGPETVAKCARCYADQLSDGREDGFADATAWRRSQLFASLAAADTLVAPSAFLARKFQRFGPAEAEVVHCRNGIPTERFPESPRASAPPFVVGYAGRIAESKGLHVLLAAFERLRERREDIELHVWGHLDPDDPYHARLLDRAGPGVRFHGHYERACTPYQAMDVLALPSVWGENSPLVLQEAFASRVPVVTADVGGMQEMVADGRDGLTFRVGDPDSLAAALETLAEQPRLVDRLREGIQAPKSLARHADEVEALYRECARPARSRVRIEG